VELSSDAAGAALTLGLRLVRDAQLEGEPAAWITEDSSSFFPPDAAEGGIDLDALTVVRLRDARSALRAADLLLRSGGFGLVVLDLGGRADLPMAAQSRLAALVRKHQSALLFLTEKGPQAPSLGSLVSLRAEALRRRSSGGGFPIHFDCELRVLKDKRLGSSWQHHSWQHHEVCRAPAGLR
jgi:recombination protein RecA